MANPGDRPFRLQSLAISVYLPTFLFAVGQGAVIPAVPLFTRDLGSTIALAGVVVALRGFGTMAFDVPAGVMVARLGEKWSMLLATTALAAVAVGAALSPAVWIFAVLVFVMGCAWAVWILARLSYVAEVAPVEMRGRALSFLGGTNRIGNFIGPILGGFAAELFGLEAAFYTQAILAGSAAVVLIAVMEGTEAHTLDHDGSVYNRLATIVKENRHVFLTAGTAVTAIGALRASRQAIIPLWGDQLGLSPGEIGLVFGASSAIDMTLFIPVGMIMDRWGRKWTGVPCLLIMSIGLMLVPLTGNFLGLMLIGLVTGFGNGFGSGIIMTLGADFSPSLGRGEFLGIWRLVSDIGTSAGPAVVGGVAGIATLGVASVVTGGLGLAGAAVMVLFMAEPLKMARVSAPP